MSKTVVASLLVLALGASDARGQAWTDWLVESTGMVTGELALSEVVGVTFLGNHYEALTYTDNPATPWSWNYAVYEIAGAGSQPPSTDQVAFSQASTNRLVFSNPVVDPFIAIMSMGQPGVSVSYAFDRSFTVFTEGQGYWGNGTYSTNDPACGPDGPCAAPSTTMTGREYHGILQFSGTFTELNWTSTAETWHSITVGAFAVAEPTAVPEPTALLLLGTGLAGLGFMAVRRRRRDELA